MSVEIWISIHGFDGRYEVSNMGRVRSVSRLIRKRNKYGKQTLFTWRGKVLAMHTWGAQYPGIVLLSKKGIKSRHSAHALVAAAFVGNPHGGTYINHIDGNGFNARASNLEWCTQSQNIKHAYETGRRAVGNKHHFSALPRNSAGYCQTDRK